MRSVENFELGIKWEVLSQHQIRNLYIASIDRHNKQCFLKKLESI